MREHGLSRAKLQPTKNWCRRLQPSGGGVVMVHVGKTGGGSLAQYFLSPRFRSCTADFCWCTTPEELAARGAASSTARAPAFCQIHLRPVRRADVDRKRLLITVRDPVDRAVSAFEFRHPTRGESAVRFPRSDFELRLYKCYDSVRAWVGGLDDATGECGDVARAAIDPLAVERGGTDRVAHGRSSQLDKGLVYYFDAAVRSLLPTLEYTLVRQEQLEDDARRALRWLGWPAPTARFPQAHAAYRARGATDLTAAERRVLAQHLGKEYELLRALEANEIGRRAGNATASGALPDVGVAKHFCRSYDAQAVGRGPVVPRTGIRGS